MKKHRSGSSRSAKIEEILGQALRRDFRHPPEGECLDAETLARLWEEKLSGPERNRVLNHLAECQQCHDVFLLGFDLNQAQEKLKKSSSRPVLLRPLALAASLLVVVTSLFILYKTGNLAGIFDRSEKEIPVPAAPAEVPEKQKFYRQKTEGRTVSLEKSEALPAAAKDQSSDAGASDEPDSRTPPGQEVAGSSLSEKNLPGTQRPLEIPRPGKADEPSLEAVKPKKGGRTPQAGNESLKERPEIQTAEKEALETRQKPPVHRETATRIQETGEQRTEEVVSRFDDGRPRTVNTYRITHEQKILSEIIEYDTGGRIISITHPESHLRQRYGYHANGNMKFAESYLNQKPHGTWIKWDARGRIIEKIRYRDGKPVDRLPME